MIRNIASILLIFLVYSVTSGQTGNTNPNKAAVEEKIILQTDRDIYLPGETIWFHADYMINYANATAGLSKVLYIELLNQKGEPVARDKFAIAKNSIDGSLVITEGLSTGYYILRAYTHYQRNFHPEQYASVIITLINPSIPLPGWPNENDTVIELVPENGVLINGIKSGMAVQFETRIVSKIKSSQLMNQFSDTISTVEILENGLGNFEFTPSDTLDYSLLTVLENGDSIATFLPGILQSGLVLESKIDNGQLFVKLTAYPTNGRRQKGKYKLGVYSQGYCKLAETELKALDTWQEINRVPKCLGPGLIYLVLKDIEGELIKVQTLLKPVKENIDIIVRTDKKSYNLKDPVNIILNATNGGEDSISQLSVSVVKKGTLNNQGKYFPEVVIRNPHLLPDFLHLRYLNNTEIDQQIRTMLTLYDSRLMTDEQFKIKIEDNNDSTFWFPETRGITIHGVVNEVSSKKAAPGVVVYAATIGDKPQFHIYTTDENGEFMFTLNYVFDLNTVFLCLRSDDEATLEILVKSDFSRVTPTYVETPLLIDTVHSRFIKELYVNAQITRNFNLYDTSKINSTTTPIRFSAPLESILTDDYIPLPTLEDVFNELVPFVKVRKRKGNYVLEVLDKKTNVLYGEPLILLDNIPIVDVNELMKIPPQFVKQIDVINSTYVYGDQVLRGIIMLKTNTEDFGGIVLPESSTFLEFNAVTYPMNFNADTFIDGRIDNSRAPDFRNLLNWNPDVELKNGKTTISLTASHHASEYEIVVRGTTALGKQVVGRASFEVVNQNR